MMEVKHSLRLLKMQMKLELNANFSSETPGSRLRTAKQAFEILNRCSLSDTEIASDCLKIIINYIQCLHDTNASLVAGNRSPTRASLFIHNLFLSDLYKHDPAWMNQIVQQYPYAFVNVNEEWCSWTKLLK